MNNKIKDADSRVCSDCCASTGDGETSCHCATRIRRSSRRFDQILESALIEQLGSRCVGCGNQDVPWLGVVLQIGSEPDQVAPRSSKARYEFMLRASKDPEHAVVRCLECQSLRNKKAERTAKRVNRERVLYNRDSALRSVANRRAKLAAIFGEKCTRCAEPASGVYFIGEPGRGPKSRTWGSSRSRLLTDVEYRREFAALCNSCKPLPYLSRAQRGEVLPPRSWTPQSRSAKRPSDAR